MWAEILRNAPKFDSAVLTFVGEVGFPYSTRVSPEPDADAGKIRLHMPQTVPAAPGRASLLFHSHDENLWNLKSFVLTGRLEQAGGGWIFRPRRFIPGMGVQGIRGYINFVVSGRRTAKKYLADRGLQKPVIDWDGLSVWLEAAQREPDNH